MPRARYTQRHDGEGFEVPLGEVYRLACCDCGLVHDVAFAYEDGRLGMAVRRNNNATAARRRAKVRQVASMILHKKAPR